MRHRANLALSLTLLAILTCAEFSHAAESAVRHTVFRSTDRGRTWSRSGTGLPGNARINAFTSLDGSVVAGTDAGVFVSRDHGQSWKASSGEGMTSGRILSLAATAPNLYAGTDRNGILISSNQGLSWVRATSFPSKNVRSLLAHRGGVYAGTDTGGVFLSSNSGLSWTPLTSGLPEHAQVFAMAELKGRIFAGLYTRGLFVWSDPERRWNRVSNVTPLALTATGEALIAGHNPGGILWSGDSGSTWARATDSSGELAGRAPVWELGSGAGLVLAGASDGIYYSEGNGSSWTRARSGLPSKSPGVSFLVTDTYSLAGTIAAVGDMM